MGSRNLLYVTLPICAAILVASAWLTNAGDPMPPPGPIVGTMKPLDIVEPRLPISSLPFTINQCGSYFLTDCLIGAAGQNGITISADDVTLDLNGFALIGVVGSLDGVAVPLARKNLTVRNGTIRNWGGDGVSASSTINSQLERLRASGNGIIGLQTGTSCLVTHCTAGANGLRGISTNDGCIVQGCSARSNAVGIFTASGCTVVDCTAWNNTVDGIKVGSGSTVQSCSALLNDGNGISADLGTVLGCTASDNGGHGVFIGLGSTIRNSSAISNGDDGFHLIGGNTIAACTALNNVGDGIEASFDCRIIGNTCNVNGSGAGPGAGDGAGIHTTGSDNRIESNNITDNDRGIDVDGAGNIIVKNTARGNTTNYDIVAGNSFGPIVNVNGVGDISGTANANHPWANFEF